MSVSPHVWFICCHGDVYLIYFEIKSLGQLTGSKLIVFYLIYNRDLWMRSLQIGWWCYRCWEAFYCKRCWLNIHVCCWFRVNGITFYGIFRHDCNRLCNCFELKWIFLGIKRKKKRKRTRTFSQMFKPTRYQHLFLTRNKVSPPPI